MSDNVWLAIIAAGPPTLIAIATLVYAIKSKNQSVINAAKIEEVHKTINSGLTVRLAESKSLGHLEGKEEQRQEDRNDKNK